MSQIEQSSTGSCMDLNQIHVLSTMKNRTPVASIALLISLAGCLFADEPIWWTEQGILIPNTASNDYAPANVGQLKSFAAGACQEMEDRLLGDGEGAGATVRQMVLQWLASNTTPLNFRPVNQGQVKATAKTIYDRLGDLGYPAAYPWTATVADDNSYAPVTLGQLKNVFNINFEPIGGKSLGRWPMDEGIGLAAYDYSKSWNDGTLMNGTAWATVSGRMSVTFDGIDDYIAIDSASDQELDIGTSSFSVFAWIKTTATGYRRIVSKGHFGWTNGFVLSVGHAGNGRVAFGIGGGTTSESVLVATTAIFNDDQWHHIAAVADWTTKEIRIFVDGAQQNLIKDGSSGGTIVSGNVLDFSALTNLNATSSQPLTISSHLGAYEMFIGQIADVRLMSGAASTSVISRIHGADFDTDGMPDWFENRYGLNTTIDDSNGDLDSDLVSNFDEYLRGSDPSVGAVSDSTGLVGLVVQRPQ